MLREWANTWGIPMAAVVDLEQRIGLFGTPGIVDDGHSEAYAQSIVRLEASRKGVLLFRNNVGALKDERGVPVRYGLANESKQQNETLKSADLIGVRPVLIGPEHIGRTIGQIVSREIKPPGWIFTGTGREPAQLNWANLINLKGGDACFATGEGTL